ncbi:amino acid ABC transporter ATP-binding/permease protein [Komagataeibacter xylinus]|uniref:amino acid ABC transporter ATP-binding/permease protein n=1 Tax=Komagataeibacter xylinus TaxID=28448 RepID=UPI0010302D0B|nr:ATP-binding cassette domain-containing protein [Komagataeibacter xylinus]
MKTWPPLVRLGRPLWPLIISGLALCILASLSNIFLLSMAGWFLAATAVAGLGGPVSSAAFNLVLPAACVRLLAMTRILTRYSERLLTHDLALRQNGIAQGWLFRRLARIGSTRLAGYRSGDLLHRCVTDSETLGRSWLDGVLPLATAALSCVITIGFAALFDGRTALLLGIALTLMGLAWPVWLAKQQHHDVTWRDQARAEAQATLIDTLQACETLLIEQGENGLRDLIYRSTLPVTASAASLARRQVAFEITLPITACLTATGITILGAARLHAEAGNAILPMLSVGALAAFDILTPLGATCSALARTNGAVKRLLDMELPPAREHIAEPLSEPRSVSFDNVTVRYPNRPDPIISNTDLMLRRGETTVLTGPSGSGKSTVMALIMGQVSATKGLVLFDDSNAVTWNTQERSASFSAVPQRAHLFHDTLRGNMSLAVPDATDEAIWSALDQAQIGNTVRNWPDGLETVLGASGARLSGGEARRIAVAQALLRVTPWLILDEATSGLDLKTEHNLLDALESLPHKPTIFHLAHREGPLDRADHVVRLEHGRVVPCRPP